PPAAPHTCPTRRSSDLGKHYIEFKNDEPDLDGHLMQGFPIDGRKVPQLEVSAMVKMENVIPGTQDPDQKPFIAITLYDDQIKQIDRKSTRLNSSHEWIS